jgi:hypothetical protein
MEGKYMAKFMWKSVLLVLLLFVGVLMGMQIAEGNMQKMQEGENKVEEASIAEDKQMSHNIDEKAQQIEKIKTFNTFSATGNAISTVVEGGFKSTVDTLLQRVIDLLAK